MSNLKDIKSLIEEAYRWGINTVQNEGFMNIKPFKREYFSAIIDGRELQVQVELDTWDKWTIDVALGVYYDFQVNTNTDSSFEHGGYHITTRHSPYYQDSDGIWKTNDSLDIRSLVLEVEEIIDDWDKYLNSEYGVDLDDYDEGYDEEFDELLDE